MNQKNKRTLLIACTSVIVVLITVQVMLQRSLENVYQQLAYAKSQKAQLSATVVASSTVVTKYKEFESAMQTPGAQKLQPETTVQLYSVVDKTLKDFGVFNSGISPSGGGQGAERGLRVDFSGPYYGLLKALASLRESRYTMKVTELSLKAASGGGVTGSMVIMSTYATSD